MYCSQIGLLASATPGKPIHWLSSKQRQYLLHSQTKPPLLCRSERMFHYKCPVQPPVCFTSTFSSTPSICEGYLLVPLSLAPHLHPVGDISFLHLPEMRSCSMAKWAILWGEKNGQTHSTANVSEPLLLSRLLFGTELSTIFKAKVLWA